MQRDHYIWTTSVFCFSTGILLSYLSTRSSTKSLTQTPITTIHKITPMVQNQKPYLLGIKALSIATGLCSLFSVGVYMSSKYIFGISNVKELKMAIKGLKESDLVDNEQSDLEWQELVKMMQQSEMEEEKTTKTTSNL